MYRTQTPFKKLVLVCTNIKENGEECCGRKGSADLHQKLKEAVKLAHPAVRVSRTGCLGMCSSGPTVIIMPDNVWFGGTTEADIPTILQYISR